LQDQQEVQKHRVIHRVVVRVERRRRPQRLEHQQAPTPQRLEHQQAPTPQRRPHPMHAKHYALDLLLLRRCMIS
jgi:hypothetical protein